MQRSLADFPASWLAEKPVAQESSINRAAIALGANIGDKFHNIEYALRLLEAAPRLGVDLEVDNPVVDVVDTSFLYESAPMYVTDQPSFINCACMVSSIIPSQDTPDALSCQGRDKLAACCSSSFAQKD